MRYDTNIKQNYSTMQCIVYGFMGILYEMMVFVDEWITELD